MAAMFGSYRLEEEIGRGPSGVVHRALDTAHDDREVAVKVVAAHLSADPGFRGRFRRDASLVAAVREPCHSGTSSLGAPSVPDPLTVP